jgi:acetyl esterase/lipase
MKTLFNHLLLLCLSAAAAMAQSGPANRFQQLDKNGDGKVSREELGDDTRFKQYDQNGDGFVTFDEARAVYRGGKGKAASLTSTAPAAEMKTAAVEVKKVLNVRYAEVPGADANLLSLDIYAPPNAAQCPVMVYVHGGGWARGDKQAVGIKPDYFCSRGWVFVSINYRLVPKVDILAQAQDAANAVAWVHTHIADHGGNPEKLHLMGHSVGAHLVALLGTHERFLKVAGKDLNILRSIIELDTQALDVPRMMKESETAVCSQAFGKDE